MNIEIVKKDILHELHRMTGHLGSKLHAAEILASTPDEELRLNGMWSNVVSKLANIIGRYSTPVIYDDKVLFPLHMPPNWREEHLSNLQLQCQVYVQNELYASWLDCVKPDMAAFHRSLNADTQIAITHLLELRKPPVRT